MEPTVLSKLTGVKKRGTYWKARCPAHPDKHASLSVRVIDGKTLVKCHAGCSFGEIKDYLGADIDDKDSAAPFTDYCYVDDEWNPIFVKRKRDKDGKKGFAWLKWDTETDKPVDCDNYDVPPGLLFRGPDVADAIRQGVKIVINEGEKACQRLFNERIVGTCQPFGAGPGKFTTYHAAKFKGADVIIWADLDEVGEKYATEIASILRPIARSIKIVQSKTGDPHDDAYDHFEAGYCIEEAVERADLMPCVGHKVRLIDEYPEVKPEFLWNPYIPAGKIVLIDADGSTGKSSMFLAMAAAISNGFLPHSHTIEPFKILYYGQEDLPGELNTIYRACDGKPGYLHVYNGDFQLTARGIQDVEDTVREIGAKLVVFDPLADYCDGVVKNLNDGKEVGPLMKSLNRVCQNTGCTIIGIRHTIKINDPKRQHTEAKNLGQGSAKWRNSARGQLVLRSHPDAYKQQWEGVVVATQERSSILIKKGRPFAFRRVGNSVEWIGPIDDPWEGRE